MRRKLAIVGAGPAGLAAAGVLAEAGCHVTLFERKTRPGRKFLLAGRGGLNLTYSEDFETGLGHYGVSAERLRAALQAFPPEALRHFVAEFGENTFIGSSGRVFPQSFRASPLLRAWLRRLDRQGVLFVPKHRFIGFSTTGALQFETPSGDVFHQADATIFALGGASWPELGADGGWVDAFRAIDMEITALQPANCGFEIAWSAPMRPFAGTPLKRIAARFGEEWIRGEAMITEDGIEGGVIYALAAHLRNTIHNGQRAVLMVDLRPDLEMEEISRALYLSRQGDSLSAKLRKKVGLPPVSIALLREATKNKLPVAPDALARLIKAVPLTLSAARPLHRAISTAGGISWDEIGPDYQLLQRPGVFVAGEMIDWEAPTGGYLLQACFSTGIAAAKGALDWIKVRT